MLITTRLFLEAGRDSTLLPELSLILQVILLQPESELIIRTRFTPGTAEALWVALGKRPLRRQDVARQSHYYTLLHPCPELVH